MLTGDPKNLLPDFARCVVRSEPVLVDAVLRNRPPRMTSMGPAAPFRDFPACLFRGQVLEANALTLRSILADAAYSLSLANSAPDTAG